MDPNFNIADLMAKLTTNPAEIVDLIPSDLLEKFGMNPEMLSSLITPELVEKAQQMASPGSVSNIMSEMKDKGMDPHKIQSQAKKAMKTASSKGPQKKVVLVTTSRKFKSRSISTTDIKSSICTILLTPSPVELSCSRLAIGPLDGKRVKIWYNPSAPGKNRLASKLVGFPIGGEIVITSPDTDIVDSDIISILPSLSE